MKIISIAGALLVALALAGCVTMNTATSANLVASSMDLSEPKVSKEEALSECRYDADKSTVAVGDYYAAQYTGNKLFVECLRTKGYSMNAG
jgi:hypothetical protein